MVAQTISLPNIRELFIPDDGFMIADADLAGADAQVVAWEAGDEQLKHFFRTPTDKGLHTLNAETIFKVDMGPTGKRQPYYLYAKKGVHATNYGASPPTVAAALGIKKADAERFQRIWFREHPAIKEWHNRVFYDLQTKRSVRNKFGFWRYYFDRVEGILPEALAWIPQSTVAITINKGWINLRKNLPQVQILLQVHDSLVFQYPKSEHPDILNEIQNLMTITIPYDDPLRIPVQVKVSEESWGACK